MIDLKRFIKDPRFRNRVIHDLEMSRKRVRLISKPLVLQVELTNRCNLNCVMCARPYYDKDKNVLGDMSVDVFNRVVPYMKYAEAVYLFGYGEPLIAKNFGYFLETAAKTGAATAIYTNGVSLNEEKAEMLVKGGLNQVTLSIDAAREETFRAIRGYSLKKITDNLLGLKRIKEKLGAPNPELLISCVLMKDNISELPDMIDLAEHIGAAAVSAGHMKIYSKKLEDQSLFHYREQAEDAFNKARERAGKKGIRLELPGFGLDIMDCYQPFNLLFINWDGKVRPCCSAAFVNEEFSFPVGDLGGDSLKSIWNNSHMIRIRKGLLGAGEMARQCIDCGFRLQGIKAHRRYLDSDE